jgi:hypothetical protein
MSAASLAALVSRLVSERGLPLYVVSLKADLDPTTLDKAFARGTKLRPESLKGVARVLRRPFLELLFEQEDVTADDLDTFLRQGR